MKKFHVEFVLHCFPRALTVDGESDLSEEDIFHILEGRYTEWHNCDDDSDANYIPCEEWMLTGLDELGIDYTATYDYDDDGEDEYSDYDDDSDDGETGSARYTVIYEGYLFDGDSDGINRHDYDDWRDVQSLINFYGDVIEVEDNEYGVRWKNGAWF